jgi:hypothetical protein
LEYAKIVEQEKQGQFAPVLPVGIVYPEKSKYRSTVIVK